MKLIIRNNVLNKKNIKQNKKELYIGFIYVEFYKT